MKITKSELSWAVERGLLSTEQAEKLISALTEKNEGKSQFSLGHVIYYLGGMLIISAMSWFMVNQWDVLGGAGICAVSIAYAAIFYLTGSYLWNQKNLKIPGGILVTAGVWMTPLIVYGFQKATGFWGGDSPGAYKDFYVWVKSGWFAMEAATIIVGIIAMRFFKFSFITFPIAFCAWFMSMDIAVIIHGYSYDQFEARRLVTMLFGFVMIGLTYIVDRKFKEDYAFWGYLFGVMAFWGALTCKYSDSEWAKAAYASINVVMIFLSVFLSRRVFIVFGGIGLFTYLSHLASRVFPDSVGFPFALSAMGLLILGLGVLYQKHQAAISARLSASLPEPLKRLRPIER